MSKDVFTLPWNELVTEARRAVQAGDEEALRELDAAFHHLFFNEARRGDEESRTEFIDGILRVVESPESRAVPQISEIQQLIARWRHLDAMMDAFRRDVDVVEDAERFVRSRTNAPKLVEILCESENQSVTCGVMAQRLGISAQNLAKLLRDLEQRDIVERHSAGRNVFLSLGLVGQLLAERRNRNLSDEAFSKPEDSFVLPPESRISQLFSNPKLNAFGQELASRAIN